MSMVVPSVLAIGIGLIAVIVGFVVLVVAVTRSSRSTGQDNPNLVACRDCGHYISLRAVICPRCGGPNKA